MKVEKHITTTVDIHLNGDDYGHMIDLIGDWIDYYEGPTFPNRSETQEVGLDKFVYGLRDALDK